MAVWYSLLYYLLLVVLINVTRNTKIKNWSRAPTSCCISWGILQIFVQIIKQISKALNVISEKCYCCVHTVEIFLNSVLLWGDTTISPGFFFYNVWPVNQIILSSSFSTWPYSITSYLGQILYSLVIVTKNFQWHSLTATNSVHKVFYGVHFSDIYQCLKIGNCGCNSLSHQSDSSISWPLEMYSTSQQCAWYIL